MIEKTDLLNVLERRLERLYESQEKCDFDVEEIRFQGGIDELEELIDYIRESYWSNGW